MTRSFLLIPVAVLVLGVAAYAASSHSSSSKSASKGGGSTSGTAHQITLNPVQRAELAFSKNAGAAFTTFDKAIYAPYQKGAFKSAKSNPKALASAGQAALEVSDEIHAAAVATTESPQLAPLKAPMKALDQGFKAALVKLKQGHFNFGEIQAASVAISSIRGAAASAGLSIPG